MVVTILSMDELGPELNRIRTKVRGLNQDEFKKLTGFSKQRQIDLEKGRVPFSQETLEGYENALGIKINVAISLQAQDMKRLIDSHAQ